MEEKTPLEDAWKYSMRLLAASSKTRREMNKKLSDKGFAQEVVHATLTKLEEKGILNDRSYASNLLNLLSTEKPSGKRMIVFEMKRHGIPLAVQEELLAGLSEDKEHARAHELARHRWHRYSRMEPIKRRKKVYDFLIRRGFDFQLARDIIEDLSPQGTDDEN